MNGIPQGDSSAAQSINISARLNEREQALEQHLAEIERNLEGAL